MADQLWHGCVVPDDLLYDVDLHVWIRLDSELATLGMTDVAQTMGGRMVQISWKKTGRGYARGRSLAVNEAAFAADIAIANRDPYGAGWLARVRPAALDSELGLLADGPTAFARYQSLIEERGIRCYRCAG